MTDRFTRWYDRQSMNTLFVIAVLPLVTVALVLLTVAVIYR